MNAERSAFLLTVLGSFAAERRIAVVDLTPPQTGLTLHVTPAGEWQLRQVRTVGQAHDDAICGALAAADRSQLRALLARLADAHHRTPGVHPGFRRRTAPGPAHLA